MSVVGFDFGNDSCYISVARAGGIESIANDYSLRQTPSYVAFSDKQRLIGVSAKSQHLTNLKRTFFDFKVLIGRKYKDPIVQKELLRLPYKVSEDPSNGDVLIHVHYMDKDQIFTPKQVTAMLLTKLKEIAETALSAKVKDCVLSVPVYYGENERRCLLDAATMADLNVLKLLNDTTASALAYGIYKQDLPTPEEKARNVIFVDIGHRGVQASACSFHKGKLSTVACTFDPHVGGRKFNDIIAKYLADDFKSKFNVDTYSNPKAVLKLLTEIEKLKKQMSANTNLLPLSIECYMDDKDVKGFIDRGTFEDLAADEFRRLEKVLQDLLVSSKWKLEDIHSVEIIGGSSRVPAVKNIVTKVFGKAPNTTLNADESVSRGCALQCAILSPTFKVREFQVTDVQPYAIRLKWTAENVPGEIEVFPQFHQIPFRKMLTFYRRSNFTLTAEYVEKSEMIPDLHIGHFEIMDVKPQADGSNQKVKVKVRINNNGNFGITNASLIETHTTEETSAEEVVPMDVEDKNEGSSPSNADESTNTTVPDSDMKVPEEDGSSGVSGTKPPVGDKKKKVIQKTIDLPVVSHVVGSLGYDSLLELTEIERSLSNQDRYEAERLTCKNTVEEYVYDIRARINDDLMEFLSEEDRSKFTVELEDYENWLYEDGENCEKDLYIGKLKDLKLKGEPVKKRKLEFDERSQAINSISHSLQMAEKIIDSYKGGHEDYAHLDGEEVNKAEALLREKQLWLNDNINILSNLNKTINPPVLVVQFYSEKKSFENAIHPLLMKPKPKVEPPPQPPSSEENVSSTGEHSSTNGDENQSSPSTENKNEASKTTMDVD